MATRLSRRAAGGVYPLNFEAVDIAGNVGYGSAILVVDDTPPAFSSLTVAAGQPYAYLPEVQAAVSGAAPTVYYGAGPITVTASITDDLAGLDVVAFPDAVGSGASYVQNGVASATVRRVYAFDAAVSFSGTVAIQASDRAGNIATSLMQLLHDITSPVLALNATSEGLTLSIAWSASDADAGLNHCVMELVDGGVVTSLASTCNGSLDYPATQDQDYTFRLTAWDNVANRAVQEHTVTASSVTKYYYHGSKRVAVRKGGQVYYLHGDHLGSTSLTTDSSGQVVHEARYLPYGQVRWENGSATTDFGFTGQRSEVSFGLMDFNARYYNSKLGAFISPDTIVPEPGIVLDWNRYLYARANPLKYTDPTGHAVRFSCPRFICNATWFNYPDKSGSLDVAIDIVAWVGCNVVITCHADPENNTVTGPTNQEAFDHSANAIIGAGLNPIGAVVGSGLSSGTSQLADKAIASTKRLVKQGLDATGASQLIDDIAKGATSNGLAKEGQTILGSSPEYIELARSSQATYLNLPTEAWNILAAAGEEYVWAVNQRFLDHAIGAGHRFVIKLGEGKGVGRYLQKEIDYLTEKGYVWLDGVVNGTLVPGK